MYLPNNVEHSFHFGSILGEIRLIGKEEDNLLLDYLDPPDKKLAQFARGYILGSIMGLGNDWALRLIEVAKDWEVNKKAETLISLSSNEDTGH